MTLVFLTLLAAGLAWSLTSHARRHLEAHGVIDVPNHRSSHDWAQLFEIQQGC